MCDYKKDNANIQEIDAVMQQMIDTARVIYPDRPLNQAIKAVDEDFATPYNFTSTSDHIDIPYPDQSDISESEEEINIIFEESHPETVDIGTYMMTWEEYEQIFRANIIIRQVIANQPRRRGTSRCTDLCDIEKHHMHTYCRICKKNLYYGTTIHDCDIGFGPGQL